MSGTIPPELAALKQLTSLELGTNFLQGTLGDWVGGLSRLEVLNLGSNLGVNAPDPATGEEPPGITGTIPASLANLTRLVELDLQVARARSRGRGAAGTGRGQGFSPWH